MPPSLRIGRHPSPAPLAPRGRTVVSDPEQTVTQVFGSALSIAYDRSPVELWEPLARLVLNHSYLATMAVAAETAARHGGAHGSRKV